MRRPHPGKRATDPPGRWLSFFLLFAWRRHLLLPSRFQAVHQKRRLLSKPLAQHHTAARERRLVELAEPAIEAVALRRSLGRAAPAYCTVGLLLPPRSGGRRPGGLSARRPPPSEGGALQEEHEPPPRRSLYTRQIGFAALSLPFGSGRERRGHTFQLPSQGWREHSTTALLALRVLRGFAFRRHLSLPPTQGTSCFAAALSFLTGQHRHSLQSLVI